MYINSNMSGKPDSGVVCEVRVRRFTATESGCLFLHCTQEADTEHRKIRLMSVTAYKPYVYCHMRILAS